MLTAADVALRSVYWPWLVEVDGGYRLYYSTDHDPGPGGIGVLTGPGPLGPWTDRGRVYVDTAGGWQTETPSVVYDPVAGLWRMFYQQAYRDRQATLLATSPDGLSWTRVGSVLNLPPGEFPGWPHTGYACVARVGDLWYAHHLMSSGDYPRFGLSWSLNGATWHIDPRPLGYEAHLLTGMTPARRVEWNTTSIVVWQGQEWWVGMLSNFTSGATPKNALIGAAPVTPELRHLIGGPRVVWAAGASWETPNLRAVHAVVVGGRLLVYYQCADRIGVLTS